MNENGILQEVQKRLGRQPRAVVLRHPRWLEEVQSVVNEVEDYDVDLDEAIESLIGWILQEEEFAASIERPREAAPRFREVPPDVRSRALARILAAEATDRPSVRSFRQEVLGGELLDPERVPAWLKDQYQNDGEPSVDEAQLEYLEVPRDPLDVESLTPFREEDFFVPVGETDRIPVQRDGVLGRLRRVVLDLTRRYGWTEHAAVRFVLSGTTPSFPQARVETFWRLDSHGEPKWRFPAEYTVRLELSVRLTPKEVAGIYRSARGEMLAGSPRPRAITAEKAELAAFAWENRKGLTWNEVMSLWNRGHTNEGYTNVRQFIRDAREAFKRVTGAPLPWRGASPSDDRPPGALHGKGERTERDTTSGGKNGVKWR